ncbi:hypothetical protein HBI16_157660 [Parastagonospora nodorum]|nr:hypothetical protein HBI10_245590 [Parastagonospora nodorum]KAH5764961.1 hypothetical protein HBI16_157660 [Parastagonospora nodorum]KAH6041109.1 hypothetical protein HBI54_149280 [Parastagonospora nodorum]
MLFRCGVVVVVFVGPGRCNTVPHRLPPPPRALRAGHQEDVAWRLSEVGFRAASSTMLFGCGVVVVVFVAVV